MVKRLMLILTFALVVGLALPAFAEVQNIKVSGDILLRGVSRDTMDFAQGAENNLDDSIAATLSTVRLRVDADLTENVQAVVRLINERVWSSSVEETSTASAQDAEIELDLGYITLKEFLYSPLTLILGRQPLRYGAGFVVGDPDTNQFSEYNHYDGTQMDTIVPEDLSSLKAFDAVRAILDYSPLVVDLIWAKIDEARVLGTTSAPENDDVDLYGVNLAYDWGTSKNLMSEGYLFVKDVSTDGGIGGATTAAVTNESNDRVITYGLRASLNPIERLYLSGELAFQAGDKFVTAGIDSRKRDAMAFQIISEYALDLKYDPVLSVLFTHYSGEESTNTLIPFRAEEGWGAWDPMFEDQAGGKVYNALFSATNSNILEGKVRLTPLEDLTLSLEWAGLWLDKEFPEDTVSWDPNDYVSSYKIFPGEDDLGQEVDVVLTYDYTEDVQLGLNCGVFMPGALFRQDHDNASQIIGSVKVAF